MPESTRTYRNAHAKFDRVNSPSLKITPGSATEKKLVEVFIQQNWGEIYRAYCRAEKAWSGQRRGSTLAMEALGTLWWRTNSREWRPAHVLRKLEAEND
jgi:hypothetical protein